MSDRSLRLIAGPRGRQLCAALLGVTQSEAASIRAEDSDGVQLLSRPSDDEITLPEDDVTSDPHRTDWTSAGQALLCRLLIEKAKTYPQRTLDLSHPLALLPALEIVVDEAAYWGPASACQDPFDLPELVVPLQSIARTFADLPTFDWLWSNLSYSAQRSVQWSRDEEPLSASPPRSDQADGPRLGERLEVRGAWWSGPTGVLPTTRRVEGIGALGLVLVEDGFGEEGANVWQINVSHSARVYEVTANSDWQKLVASYPKDVTKNRQESWAWTGWNGKWLLPNWSAVSHDWDAVHLSVSAYLSLAGVRLSVGPHASTMLAGWNPDETYWLRPEVSTADQPPERWVRYAEASYGWTQVSGLPSLTD
jgi:hypothetical protein